MSRLVGLLLVLLGGCVPLDLVARRNYTALCAVHIGRAVLLCRSVGLFALLASTPRP
jgi:hypothetical protein